MTEVPSVKRLVMFRHGVAYVERSGAADGDFEMSFKRDEMNDVLKSLSVWVASGDGRVGAVGFEAPDDPREALRDRNLLLEPGQVAQGLLTALCGRSVVIQCGDDEVRGEVIGIEQTPGGESAPRRQLVLRTGDGSVGLVDLATARSLQLSESPSRADLDFLIDRSRAASTGTSRSVSVQLAGRADDLRVAYVIPAPVWRVSYRLAVEADEAVLMAWAIVHNPVDENLDEIQLTLTTGQPVSFVIDLYEAKRVQRTKVEETSRAAAAPTQFERAPRRRATPKAGARPPAPGAAAPYPAALPPAAPQPMPAYGMADAMAAGMGSAGEDLSAGVERGELFEYQLSMPVSLKRGGSAMVPLATAKPKARKERIWRDGSGPNPDLVLTFDNDTELVLEEGPLVVYDEGSYAGEAMVPYSARGAQVRLAFAKDLAVRCRHDTSHHSEMAGVRLGDKVLAEEHLDTCVHKLRADSDHGDDVEVVFELRKTPGRSIDNDGPKPIEETASYWRFQVTVPAHGTGQLEVSEIWRRSQRVQYSTLSASQLKAWLDRRHLDEHAYKALSGVLQAWEQAAKLDSERAMFEQIKQAAFDKQSKLSEQLAVLRDSGDEGKLRLRYVRELGDEQTKVNDCEDKIRRLYDEATEQRAEAERRLAKLTGG